jgi:hypothetical protein
MLKPYVDVTVLYEQHVDYERVLLQNMHMETVDCLWRRLLATVTLVAIVTTTVTTFL